MDGPAGRQLGWLEASDRVSLCVKWWSWSLRFGGRRCVSRAVWTTGRQKSNFVIDPQEKYPLDDDFYNCDSTPLPIQFFRLTLPSII